jgi:glycosyltransferase involved in cell wall biosynthesis
VLPYRGQLFEELHAGGVGVVIHADLAVIGRNQMKHLTRVIRLALSMMTSTFHLYNLIRDFKPQLVHTITSVLPTSGLAAKLAGVPHIWHVRESFGEFGALWKYYQRFMVWSSTAIVCVSTPIAEQFSAHILGRKVYVIHNGFPANEFGPVDAGRVNKFKATYSLERAEALIGVVGRVKYLRKGQEIFVEAARLLRPRHPNVRFLCIGSPFPGNEAHLQNLLRLIGDYGLEHYVIYTGDVEDVKAAIAALDVLVLSSVQPEPFAGVVIEAMALARPVVATGTGGSIEQVVDGVTGYLVKPEDPQSMAAAIEKLVQSPDHRRALGENGRARFLEKFEFETFYERILELYKQVI